MKNLFVLLLLMLCFLTFTACTEQGSSYRDDYTETGHGETETQHTPAYDLTAEYDRLKKTLSENKELFTESALLLLRQETDVLLIFDEGILTDVNSDGNNLKAAAELFDESETDLLNVCYDKISKSFPDCKGILIGKVTPETMSGIYSDCVQFTVRAESESDYFDFGMVYSEENMNPNSYRRLDENWYGFTFVLV